MTRLAHTTCVLLSAGVLTAISGSPPGGENSAKPNSEVAHLRAEVQLLSDEVRTLRSLAFTILADRHREAIRQIQAEMSTLASQRTRLAEVDRARQQDLEELDDLLRSRDPAQRLELESARADLAGSRVREIREQSEAIGARETELSRRLETEQQALRRVQSAWDERKGKAQ